jgi:pyruvate/2-oxoglutarate/acetoin dehydrogenase E1 component
MTAKNPWHRNRLIRDGIYAAIEKRMAEDPSVYLLGEGAHMKVHFDAPSIERRFGARVLTMPISEDANSNFAVGLSLAGLVPIVDVISSDFLFRTMDAICNTMAKMETVGKGRTIIVRSEFMTGGPTSGQRIEAMFTHVPGLTVVVPSDADSAQRLMTEALDRKGVTIFFEDRMIEDFDLLALKWPAPPRNPNPFLAVVSYGITRILCRQAIEDSQLPFLKDSVDLFDLPVLSAPVDLTEIMESISHHGKLLIVEPTASFMGIGAEIAAQVGSRFANCEIVRLGSPRITIPASRELHDHLLPSAIQIRTAIRSLL